MRPLQNTEFCPPESRGLGMKDLYIAEFQFIKILRFAQKDSFLKFCKGLII